MNTPTHTHPDVSIALLTWNRKSYLEKGLPKMFANLSKSLRHEILIMDNASVDGTLEYVRQFAGHREVRIVANAKNLKFKGYNRLFGMAKGDTIIELDDDVIDFPRDFDRILHESLAVFPEFGFVALDTVKNEKTDGGWPGCSDPSKTTVRGGLAMTEGPAKGYCAAFRRRDYSIIRPFTFFFPFSLSKPQDYVVSGLIRRLLRKKSGILDGIKCLHANGPIYAEEFGRLDFDRMKLLESDCRERLSEYESALENRQIYSP